MIAFYFILAHQTGGDALSRMAKHFYSLDREERCDRCRTMAGCKIYDECPWRP